MNLTKSDKQWIEHYLRKLDFVEWDRFLIYDNAIGVFGWINRENDKYKDFVLLMFMLQNHTIDYITSSKKYSERFHKLCGGKEGGHEDCRRVEDYFDVKNCIKVGD